MSHLNPGPFSGLEVGGRSIPDPNNVLTLYARLSSGYSTLRLNNTTAGYVVPAGKQLRIIAIQSFTTNNAYVYGGLGYGDTDAGESNGSAPANAVFVSSSVKEDFICGGDNTLRSEPINFTIPAGKYPLIYGSDRFIFRAWGVLESV